MSVVDDLKDTFKNSDRASGRSEKDSNSSNFDNNSFSDEPAGFDSAMDSSQGNREPSPRSNNTGRTRENSRNSQGPSLDQDQSLNGRGDGRSRRNTDHPNAQAGRPQQGSSQPQLSSQTQRKMENAGLRDDRNQDQNRLASDQHSDMEELKSQNEQIIELLKRVNRNLEKLGR